MMRHHKEIQKLTLYASNLGLVAAVSLVSVPVYIASAGAAAWGAIALGQSVGVVASVAIVFGWGVTGSARFASMSSADRAAEIVRSIRTRLALTIPVLGLGTLAILAILVDSERTLFALSGLVSTAALGYRMNWVFIALDRPGLAIVLEAVPRALVQGSALVLLLVGSIDVKIALVMQGGGQILATSAVAAWARREFGPHRGSRLPGPRSRVRDRSAGTAAAVLSATFGAAPVALVQILAPSALPAFALLQRAQSQLNTALSPAVDYLQAWVHRGSAEQLLRRARASLRTGAAVAIGTMAVGVVVMPALVAWLGADTVRVPLGACLLSVLVLGLSFIVQVLNRSVLAANRMLKAITRSTMIAAALTLASVAILASKFGLNGALCGVIIGLMAQAMSGYIWFRRIQA